MNTHKIFDHQNDQGEFRMEDSDATFVLKKKRHQNTIKYYVASAQKTFAKPNSSKCELEEKLLFKKIILTKFDS